MRDLIVSVPDHAYPFTFQQPCLSNLNPIVRNCHLFTQSEHSSM